MKFHHETRIFAFAKPVRTLKLPFKQLAALCKARTKLADASFLRQISREWIDVPRHADVHRTNKLHSKAQLS